ncbi:hypothetical protein HD554DRAFT_1583893 [Boletus coccyginus]|nr:hypothetical protein HD554DRAFT_1583893 [Boletus coccyginus]
MRVSFLLDIELQTQPRPKWLGARKHYIRFFVGETSCLTNSVKEVYQKHSFKKDELVGSLTDTIGGILGKLKDGVFEKDFRKDTSDGSDLSGITIKFALAAELRADASADECQAADAVAAATAAVNPLSLTPPAVGLLGSAVDTSTHVLTEVQTFDTTWGVLLQRMELFNKIVAGIAEIHPYASLAWSVISAANQVLVNQKNRDEQIICLAGTMSDIFAFVHDAEPLKAIESHMEAIKLLTQQVAECGYFITEYAKQKNFCQSRSLDTEHH